MRCLFSRNRLFFKQTACEDNDVQILVLMKGIVIIINHMIMERLLRGIKSIEC